MKSSNARGFSLLEVMIAIGILALCFTAIGGADSVAILYGSRYHGLTTASLLMRGVVMDIEAEYQEDGFPENSITNRNCEVPREFRDQMECEYDLEALEIDPAELQSLVEQGVASFLGGGGAGGEDDEKKPARKDGKSGKSGKDDEGGEPDLGLDMSGLADQPGMSGLGQLSTAGFDPTALLVLAPLFGPEGQAILDVCNLNIDAMLQRFMGMSAFFPMIVEEAAKVTRKLTVRLTWKSGPKAERTLEITTFIVGLPEEEMRKLREAENLQEISEDVQGLMSPDGGVPGQRGGGTTTRGGGAAGGGRGGGTK